MNLEEIKNHWLKQATEFETDLKATTKTSTIKQLEINALAKAIRRTHFFEMKDLEILEVGCGNGYNCFALASLFPNFNFTGVDYVPEMIENARRYQRENPETFQWITFHTGNLLSLENNKDIKDEYHIVFTDRCIINLNTIDLQFKAFTQLAKKVKPGGYLIILENSMQRYNQQNHCRESVSLPSRNPDPYNLFIDEEIFLSYAKRFMKLVNIDDFGSLHDIVLYVLIPMINNGEVDYDHPLVKAATELSISISGRYDNPFGDFGQNRLFLFHKDKE